MVRDELTWVTKTDMTRFVRCPYSFWLLDSGQITFEETLDEFQVDLLAAGCQFQDLVESSLLAVEMSLPEMLAMLDAGATLFGTPNFYNQALRIRGRPDGIVGGDGALIPIEVKSHRDVQPIDELELAFYWLLLEPFRNDPDALPEGRLVLRRDGAPVTVSVRITPDRLSRVAQLLDSVRVARRRGVEPRICRCRVCSTLRRDEVMASVIRRKDPTMLYGVAGVYSELLRRFRFTTWESLLGCDVNALAARFAAVGYPGVTPSVIERWRLHARSFAEQAPVFAKPAVGLGVSDRYIAVDLEYDQWIWLVGACVVDGDEREYHFLWADSPTEERVNLERLFALISEHGGMPVVTWSGTSADIPALRKAADRHNLAAELTPLLHAHRDLFRWAENNLRVPVPGLGLKEVERYFGVARVSDVGDGLQAVLLYQEYLASRDPEIRERLVHYNRDDVDSLILVLGELQALGRAAGLRAPSSPPARQRTSKRALNEPGNSLGEQVRDELVVVPLGAVRGPERLYRMHYLRYRLKSLGKTPDGLLPSRKAAHDQAMATVWQQFPDFVPTWEIE
jgi:predicted RecB family nuclease